MEGLGQEALDLAKGIIVKVNPIITWLAVKIAEFVELEVKNVHMILVFLIAGILAKFITEDAFSLKHIIITIIIFLGLSYIGLSY
jgi:hypothetical protein